MSDTSQPKKDRKARRDPERTRNAILEVAGKLMAKDGPEGLSVSEVAQRAGVNRGTAYHHFPTREKLLEATKAWVSEMLCNEVFGANDMDPDTPVELGARLVTEKLCRFAMENPEFGRVWLYDVLSSNQPANDPFWNMFKKHVDDFVTTDRAMPGVDAEVHAVLMLVGVFLWPVWARAHTHSAEEREKMAKRYTDEVLRMNLNGTFKKEGFPDLVVKGS